MAGKRSLSPSPTQPLTKPPDRRITQPARRCLKSISTTFETQPAAADYWLTSKLKTFIGRTVFNAVLIDRNRETRVLDPIEQMLEALDEGSSLIIFPEGQRNTTDQMLPFKPGIFHLAEKRPDVELVPVWIENLNRVLPKGEVIPIPFACSVTFGAPIHLQDGEDKQTFLKRAEKCVLNLSPNADNHHD